MASNLTALKAMSDNLTNLSDQRAAQKLAGQQVQLQSAISQLPKTGGGVAQVQALGGKAAEAASGARVEALKETQQLGQQIGGAALQAQAVDYQGQINAKSNQLDKETRNQAATVARLSKELSSTTWDERVTFETKANGEKFLNETQLQDWLKTKGVKEEEWKNYAAKAETLHKRKTQYIETMYKCSVSAIEKAAAGSNLVRNTEQMKKLREMKSYWQEQLADAQNEAANKGAMWVAGGTIVGAVVGGIYGGPAGAKAGGEGGGAVGQIGAAKT